MKMQKGMKMRIVVVKAHEDYHETHFPPQVFLLKVVISSSFFFIMNGRKKSGGEGEATMSGKLGSQDPRFQLKRWCFGRLTVFVRLIQLNSTNKKLSDNNVIVKEERFLRIHEWVTYQSQIKVESGQIGVSFKGTSNFLKKTVLLWGVNIIVSAFYFFYLIWVNELNWV